MNNQEDPILPQEAESPKSLETAAPNKSLVQQAKSFRTGVMSPFKGKDVAQMVEDFTAEMTLVLEGISEDQTKLTQDAQRLGAQQTELEQRMLDGFHDAGVAEAELRKEINALRTRLDKAEKQIQDKKGKTNGGVVSILRQATWLVGIVCVAWVVVTIIGLFK